MTTPSARQDRPVPPRPIVASLGRRIAGQGAMLFTGFAVAQSCSFARNALFGHWLSKGDFGIAAAITLALQLLETLSDLGADRLIVQAPDGDDRRLIGAAHLTLVLRGLLAAGLLYLLAGPTAVFFRIPQAQFAFELAAFVPLLKGLMHLDSRRQQRLLDNQAYLTIEVVPQVVALALTIPALYWSASYQVVVWVAIAQALLAVIVSHVLAQQSYTLATTEDFLMRVVKFGWPIWLSAFPLVGVFQADRMIIGNVFGIESLASYTTAFMITMVPGLVVAKVGHALMLPLLSQVRTEPGRFMERVRLLSEATALLASTYLIIFVIAGGAILPVAFGANYAGLHTLVAILAVMWTLRMVQALPGMALMADGNTLPLLTAGMIRGSAVVLALASIPLGLGVKGVAAAGIIGELASLIYVSLALEATRGGFARIFLGRMLLICVAATMAGVVTHIAIAQENLKFIFAVAMVSAVAVVFFGLATMPSIRTLASREIRKAKTPTAHA